MGRWSDGSLWRVFQVVCCSRLLDAAVRSGEVGW